MRCCCYRYCTLFCCKLRMKVTDPMYVLKILKYIQSSSLHSYCNTEFQESEICQPLLI